ncbi:hypothetical protein BST61_g7636 [Cercospora zeina]
MEAVVQEYTSLASAISFATPQIPVASTLLARVVTEDGILNARMLGEHMRRRVEFVASVQSVHASFPDAVWLEIGPGTTCSSFVKATLSLPSSQVISSLEHPKSNWQSMALAQSALYKGGIVVDWTSIHAPFISELRLVTLPAYAWDMTDFWITHTEEQNTRRAAEPKSPNRWSTCADYVVRQSDSDLTMGVSLADPHIAALVNGHRIRGIPLCPGSVVCESGLSTALYFLTKECGRDLDVTDISLHNVSLERPITQAMQGAGAELRTTIRRQASGDSNMQISWTVEDGPSSLHMATGSVQLRNSTLLQAEWERMSHFVRARMQHVRSMAHEGKAHRMLPDIFYSLFQPLVAYDSIFKGVRDVYVAPDFDEGVSSVVLPIEPQGTKFSASPYWGECLMQLAGFLVNASPRRIGSNTTFIMDRFDSFDQCVKLQPQQEYQTFAHVSQQTDSTARCDVYIFDGERLIGQCVGLQFHRIENHILDKILKPGRAANVRDTASANEMARVSTTVGSTPMPDVPATQRSVASTEIRAAQEGVPELRSIDSFEQILTSISETTAAPRSQLSDETELQDIGIDSIMAIEIAANVSKLTGSHVLPSLFVEHRTIGSLRKASSMPPTDSADPHRSVPKLTPEFAAHDNRSESSSEDSFEHSSSPPSPLEAPPPQIRITLMQGRPLTGRSALYLIADGTGSITTYIHLPQLKSQVPIYGIDSPFLKCPERLRPQDGIVEAGTLIADALVKAQPEGSFLIGGFSGGAMVSYEVYRQLLARGRAVKGLILLDMCCPRPPGTDAKNEAGWKTYEAIARRTGSMWKTSDLTRRHLQAVFAAVAAYHPSPIPEHQRTARVVILLQESNISTQPFPGFMQDKAMGAIGWGIPDKTESDLGPNGWDAYVGEALCLSVDADHLEMPGPKKVHLLCQAMEKAFEHIAGA